MTLLDIAVGFAVGFFVGIGAALFYLKWKMGRQLNAMQSEMQNLMDMTGEMNEGFEDLDDLEVDAEVEEKGKEEN